MELTPQQLCDVEFSEQWRGYSRDQVDDFIERVAAAVSTLQDRLRKMTERAVRAEQRSQEGSEADGAARRTLVLAQRTADATVAEAKETAARLVAQAQEEARAIILAAENAVETVPTVEPTARAEIADLEVTRSRLQADVAALESHVTDRRARIKGLLDELQLRVDEGFDGRIAQWPSAGEPTPDDEPAYEDDTGIVIIDDDEPVDEPVETASIVDTASAVDTTSVQIDAPGQPKDDTAVPGQEELLEEDEHDDVIDLSAAPAEQEPGDPSEDAPPSFVTEAEPAPAGTADAASPQDDLSVPTGVSEFTDLSTREVDDDTFFAQLRGALDDDAPLGPREDPAGLLRWREETATAVAEAPSLYDQGEPERRKFGRKKRRQG